MSATRYLRLRRNCIILVFVVILILQSAVSSTPSLKTLGPGADAPEFNLRDSQALEHKFSRLLGKKLTVIVFWASWSRKSAEALTDMQQLYDKEAGKGLSVVGVNVEKQNMTGDDLKQAGATFARLGLSYPNLSDRNLETFHAYGVIAVPTIVVIDKEVKIVFEMSGYPLVKAGELRDYVQEYLGGKSRAVQSRTSEGYQPQKRAVRYFNLGLKARQSARTSGSAENYLKKAIEADPGFIRPYVAIANLYRQQGSSSKAAEMLEKALAIEPRSAPALFEFGLVEVDAAQFETAADFLHQAIEADEFFTPAYYLLGYLAGREGDLKTAELLFAKAREQNPMDYQLYRYKGQMYELHGEVGEATASYRHSLEILLGLP